MSKDTFGLRNTVCHMQGELILGGGRLVHDDMFAHNKSGSSGAFEDIMGVTMQMANEAALASPVRLPHSLCESDG
jgi:hypothetical protein